VEQAIKKRERKRRGKKGGEREEKRGKGRGGNKEETIFS
jgi:hypothetical protein